MPPLTVIKRECTFSSNWRLNKTGLKSKEMKTHSIKMKVRSMAHKLRDRPKEVWQSRYHLDRKMSVAEVAPNLVTPMHTKNLSSNNSRENMLA